jgi:hypothetical protein
VSLIGNVDMEVEVRASDAALLARLSGLHPPAETLSLLLRETRDGESPRLTARVRDLLGLPPAPVGAPGGVGRV